MSEAGKDGPRRTLQFFDAAGTALHKNYLLPESDLAAYPALVARFRAADQSPGARVEAWAPKPEPDGGTVDVGAFHADWDALQDTHDFITLLRPHKFARLRRLRLGRIRRPGRAPALRGAQSIDRVLGLHIAKVDDYIAKPFSPQELLTGVEKVLNKPKE